MADLRPFGATPPAEREPNGPRRDAPRRDGATRRRGRGRDRAQLILITGFIIAAVLVALAVVMNAAIYTENLATRSESSGATDAATYQRSVEQGAREAFDYAHDVSGASDYPGLEDSVEAALADFDAITMRQQVKYGHIANVTVYETTRGTRTSKSGDFTDSDGDDDWVVATSVDEFRDFRMELDRSELATEPDDEFRVVVDFAGGGRWYMNATDSASGAVIGVNASGTYETCTTNAPVFTVDVTAGTVDGEDCPPLDVTDVVDSGTDFTMRFENASRAVGDYSLVVEQDAGSMTAPNEEKVLYKTVLELVFRTGELDYRSRVEVAPGDADE